MVRIFFCTLAVIIIALLLAVFYGFPDDPGYILVSYESFTFETSLFALLAALILIALLLRLLFIVLHWLNPLQWFGFSRNYAHYPGGRTRSKTIEGLLYFTRRNWESSYKLLNRGMKDPDASVVNYLAAAYASYKMGKKEQWADCLDQGEKRYPVSRSTINSLRAQLLFKSSQIEQSLAVLENLRKTSLNDSTLLTLLKDIYIKLNDWEKMETLLPALKKDQIISEEEAGNIEKRLHIERLYKLAAEVRKQEDKTEGLVQLNHLWKRIPLGFKQDYKVVEHYSKLLISLEAYSVAVKIVEAALNRHWSDELVDYYGAMGFADSQRQLAQAEAWLKLHPENAALFLALGRISIRLHLWQIARDYIEKSLKVYPSATAHLELYRLLKSMGESSAAEKHLEKYVAFLGGDISSLPMEYLPNPVLGLEAKPALVSGRVSGGVSGTVPVAESESVSGSETGKETERRERGQLKPDSEAIIAAHTIEELDAVTPSHTVVPDTSVKNDAATDIDTEAEKELALERALQAEPQLDAEFKPELQPEFDDKLEADSAAEIERKPENELRPYPESETEAEPDPEKESKVV